MVYIGLDLLGCPHRARERLVLLSVTLTTDRSSPNEQSHVCVCVCASTQVCSTRGVYIIRGTVSLPLCSRGEGERQIHPPVKRRIRRGVNEGFSSLDAAVYVIFLFFFSSARGRGGFLVNSVTVYELFSPGEVG